MASILNAPHFHDEQAACEYVEAHLWLNGPVCPHCGKCDAAKVGKLNGKTTRAGLRKCYECRKPFTVKMGTIFEDSHAPLRFWLQAIYLMCSSKKGISTRQLQRTLGVGMKTAWFMGHRIRLARAPADGSGPIGGEGKTVEADETDLSKSLKARKIGPKHSKPDIQILSLVERGGVFQHMDRKHLDRHLAEFDFRQDTRAKLGINDLQRAAIALKGFKGKRLTYRTTHS